MIYIEEMGFLSVFCLFFLNQFEFCLSEMFDSYYWTMIIRDYCKRDLTLALLNEIQVNVSGLHYSRNKNKIPIEEDILFDALTTRT